MSAGDPWSPGLPASGSVHWNGLTTQPSTRSGMPLPVAGRPGHPVDATGLAVPDLLATIVAAAAARLPVRIGTAAPATDPVLRPIADPLPADTFLVVSTSGSTAAPRAIARTLASWTRSFDGYTALTGLTPSDRLLLTGPPTSTLQLFAAVHALAIGAEVTDDRVRATAAVCVPAVLPELIGLPRLRSVVVAGARLPEDVARQAVSSGLRVAEYYGAAELSFVAARQWPTDPAVRPGPLRPFPGVEVDLRDGELWSRSAYHCSGCLGTPGGLRTDAAGFATVGDLARGDAKGLTVLGRGDTATTVGGRTILVEDVELAIGGIDGVADAAVAGVPHPRLGQQLVALVALAPGADAAQVRATARTMLTGESLPRRWVLADRVPRTAGGKIDRAAVRSMMGDG